MAAAKHITPIPKWLDPKEPSPCGTAMGGPCNRHVCLACNPLRDRLREWAIRQVKARARRQRALGGGR